MRKKIKLPFIIVVEGKTDTIKLKQLFDVNTIETNGSDVNEESINLIRLCLQKKENIVFMLDPDVMGNKIRTKLNQIFPNIKNIFLQYKDMQQDKSKIGVAEAKDEVLINLLTNVDFNEDNKTSDLVWQDMLDLNIIFDSKIKEIILNKYHLPKVNNKKLFQYLVMLKINRKELVDVISSKTKYE